MKGSKRRNHSLKASELTTMQHSTYRDEDEDVLSIFRCDEVVKCQSVQKRKPQPIHAYTK